MRLVVVAGFTFGSMLLGCHSAYVEATVRNATLQPISLMELDYPSASFGTQTLAPGAEYKYRFKVLGSGGVTLSYTDAGKQERQVKGPELKEGDEGTLGVTVGVGGVDWKVGLKNR